jgi:long-chain fatty acid transport protein
VKTKTVHLSHPPLVRAVAAAVIAALAATAAPQAGASAFQLKENSVKALGRAFAGSGAAPDDAAVVVNNPAAMSEVDRAIFQADVSSAPSSPAAAPMRSVVRSAAATAATAV